MLAASWPWVVAGYPWTPLASCGRESRAGRKKWRGKWPTPDGRSRAWATRRKGGGGGGVRVARARKDLREKKTSKKIDFLK